MVKSEVPSPVVDRALAGTPTQLFGYFGRHAPNTTRVWATAASTKNKRMNTIITVILGIRQL